MNNKKNPAFESIINGLNQSLNYANDKMPSIKRRKVSIAPIPDFDGEKVRSLAYSKRCWITVQTGLSD